MNNYPNIDWEHMNADLDKESELFSDNMNENLLVQHINVNTRHKLGNSPSKLDLVFTNEEDMVEDINCLAPLGKSDHHRYGLSHHSYADDILLYMIMDHSNNNWRDGLARIQLCVSEIREWMNQNM